jgi:uncharacterized membrane protein (TIGR02234 family)
MTRSRSTAREIAAIAAACALGGGAALFAASQVWLRLSAARTAPLPPVTAALTGRDVEPLVPALGVVALAALVALLATRGWARTAVGAVLAAAGLVLLLRSLPHVAAPSPAHARALLLDQGRATGEPAGAAVTADVEPAWPLLAAAGGALLLAGGLGAVLRGRRWPGMSARYERPDAARPAPPEATAGAAWDALDRGQDPTVG